MKTFAPLFLALLVSSTARLAAGQQTPCQPSWVPTFESGSFHALAVFDDGNGPALYAGGDFAFVGGVQANNIAKWDGSSWSDIGAKVAGTGLVRVNALTVFDDGGGAGPALYAGGTDLPPE